MEQNTPDPYCHFKSDAARERALRHKEDCQALTTTLIVLIRAVPPMLLALASLITAISLLQP